MVNQSLPAILLDVSSVDWQELTDVRAGQDARPGRPSLRVLQIVRSVRDGARVRQELVASLGRRDLLVATGKLDQLLQALARFNTRLRVVEAAKDERFVAREAKTWGPALVFALIGLPLILAANSYVLSALVMLGLSIVAKVRGGKA